MTDTALQAAYRRQRVVGALVGSVVGDALGAPFEFGSAGAFTARFPGPARGLATEMCGGGGFGWRPGEWTDDTQMALLLAASLLDCGGLDEADLYRRFTDWLHAGPRDVGGLTRRVLGSGLAWQQAAGFVHFEQKAPAAGNGSLMRTTPAALFYARADPAATADAARRISALTHADPAAGEGCAIYHRLLAAAVRGEDPLTQLPGALDDVPAALRPTWQRYLRPDWTPDQATERSGAVWPTLATAVWALRRFRTVETALRAVVDLGGDTDTRGAVTGGLLGAVHGIQAIPCRWASALTGDLPGHPPVAEDLGGLQALAARLDGQHGPAAEHDPLPAIEPREVLDGLWLTNLDGVAQAPRDALVISLCRTFGRVPHRHRRQVYLTDNGRNLDLDTALTDVLDTIAAVRAEGHPVVVHCRGGQSRTGLVLRAWLRRTRGLTPDQATAHARSSGRTPTPATPTSPPPSPASTPSRPTPPPGWAREHPIRPRVTKHPNAAPRRLLCVSARTPTRTVPDPTEDDVPIDVVTTRYGAPAYAALRGAVAAAKARDALAPVTVVVPDGRTGVTARRALARGLGTTGRPGVAALTLVTVRRLAEHTRRQRRGGIRAPAADQSPARRARPPGPRARPWSVRTGGAAPRHRLRTRGGAPSAASTRRPDVPAARLSWAPRRRRHPPAPAAPRPVEGPVLRRGRPAPVGRRGDPRRRRPRRQHRRLPPPRP